MVLFILAIIVFVICLAYILREHNLLQKVYLASKLPGPPALPIIGNGTLFINKSGAENFMVIRNLVTQYGDVFRLWLGPDLNIFLSNPKDVEILLSSSKFINKSGEYKYIKPWLSEGLLVSDGKKWFQRRKILTPGFHFKILEEFVEIFDRQSTVMMRTLAPYSKSREPVELHPIGTLYALDVICESAMGTMINAQQNSNSEYVLAVKELSHVVHLRMFDVLLRIDFLFMFSELYRKMSKALRVLHGFTDKIIRERRNEILKSTNSASYSETGNEIGEKRKMAFLDILLQARIEGEPLTDLDIREEVDTFMFEGHDTTTSAITFCLYNIAKYPEVQRKCFEEIRTVLGDDQNKGATLTELNNLQYMDLVIKETLRLFPSVPLIGRHIAEEVTINNRTYPAGCNIVVPIFSMGRNAELFSDPLEFRPERFNLDEMGELKSTFAYIPFSAGPRNCIGQKFAMLELKAIVSRTLRHYEIQLDSNSEAEPIMLAELILVPESKMNFFLKPRMYKY